MSDAYIVSPGTAGNYITGAAIPITGDLDVEVDVRLADWSPPSIQYLASTYDSNTGWFLRLGTNGELTVQVHSPAGANARVSSSVAAATTDGERHVIRCTWEMGVTTDAVTWYVDGVDVGNTTAFTAPAAIVESAYPVHVFGANATQHLAGDGYAVTVRDGIGGSVLAAFDADDVPGAWGGGSKALSNGASWVGGDGTTWTVAGTGLTLTGGASAEALRLHGDALFAYILENDNLSVTDTELVGALNELNGTTGVEYAQARGTYLGVPPAG